MTGSNLRPAVFFDRDGIVNASPGPGYVERREDFHLIPEFFEALRIAAGRGYEAVIVTNQRGVGRGLMPAEELDRIHDALLDEIRARGLRLLDILVCTSVDNADPRRKPNPGMLIEAAERYGLDLGRSWMIGDSETDIEAGRRAGCGRTVRVAPADAKTAADARVTSMGELAAYLNEGLPDVRRA